MVIIQTILYTVIGVVFIASLIISGLQSNYDLFARCGSIITIVPIIISIMDLYSDKQAIFYAKNNYARYAPDNIDEQANAYWPVKVIVNSAITIVGTLIWGFGDLIGN